MTELFVPAAKPVHLVKNFDEVPAKKRIYPLVAQEKHDGCYGFAVVKQNDYRILSRTGKSDFISLKHLSDELRRMHEELTPWADFSPCMLIFEIKADNMSAAAIAGRCQDESNLFPEAYAVVHDCIPYKDFVAGSCKIPYADRYEVARSVAKKLNWQYSDWHFVFDEKQAREFADNIILLGGEGAVFKRPDGTWTAGKKNEMMMKIKQELSYDLEVTGIERGDADGKYAGTLGTLVLRFRRFGKSDGELVEVYVSGMSDAERNAWFNDPDLIIGKIVQVDAMRFTEFGMLREPRFKGIRYDKEVADIV